MKRVISNCYYCLFFRISLLLSFCLYLSSILITINDSESINQWKAFFLWFGGIAILPLGLGIKKLILVSKKKRNYLLIMERKERITFISIVVLALIFSFLFLVRYPFVSIYDQVRDGGLNTYQIISGLIKNIFSYGRYGSHGLIIPVLNIPFYKIFGPSVLTFRFPAALLATMDVVLLYFVAKRSVSEEMAPIASLILLTLPLHLYYGRTEIVVMYSSFFTSLLLLILCILLEKNDLNLYGLLGLIAGFSSNFHTSIRTVALFTVFLIFFISFHRIRNDGFKKTIAKLIVIIIFFMIGFGPRILFSPAQTFFQLRSLRINNSPLFLLENYKKSILVYFKEPTFSTHYPDFRPILDPLLAFFFIIGFLFALFQSKNKFLKILCLYILVIPLINSAITDAVNSDNRLLPTLPIISLITGYGFYNFLRPISRFRVLLTSLLIIWLIVKGIIFFSSESAAKNYQLQDYLSMHAIYFLKFHPKYQVFENYCLNVSPKNFNYFKLMHVQEQYQYFLPGKDVYIIKDESLNDNQLVISASCTGDFQKSTVGKNYCLRREKFVCPLTGSFIIFSEEGSLFSKTLIIQKEFIRINSQDSLAP